MPAADVPTPPPFQWRAGQRVAPNFVLRDQDGKTVSIARFRGHPVILTFTDPLCRNLCPLEAHLLNQVVSQMPGLARPAIVAVSVDPPADARANLLLDERKWSLVPEWHWAVGPHAELASIWKRYSIGVSVTTGGSPEPRSDTSSTPRPRTSSTRPDTSERCSCGPFIHRMLSAPCASSLTACDALHVAILSERAVQ